ncbi:MAG TPA: 4-hydroxythreonine-4-phosphate dehydrogenase PdxA [Stellaceae bacterium]|nr:4-hydroxythreonine-4-phosphate dehydrogenase PdxA [Stellaceae bacterium]
MANQRVAISIGDPAGIGPEVALKAALDERVRAVAKPVLVGDAGFIQTHALLCGLAPALRSFSSAEKIDWRADGVLVLDPGNLGGPLAIGKVAASHGRSAYAAVKLATEAALAGAVDAVVAAPITEVSIRDAGIAFDGNPSFLARCAGVPEEDVFLMHCFDAMRIVHTTLHVGVARAVELITEERVRKVVAETDRTLRRLGVAAPRIAVSGLNPHAGEDGMFGDEEIRIISPALEAMRGAGFRVDGPFGADTMFRKPGYDAFIVMIHDQGHITSKLLAPNRIAGLAIGTGVLFSSVAHGSALDIAGTNQATPEGMIEAVLRLAGAAEQRQAA